MAAAQLWFFVWENLKSQSFTQHQSSLEAIKQEGIGLNFILSVLSLSGDAEEYSFFIHSESMKASVQVLNDEAIHGTWQLYCVKDKVVTITVRKINDPSPSTSRAPSYSQALHQRRIASGGLPVPEIPLHAPPQRISSTQDPVLMMPIGDLPEEDKVIIVTDNGTAQAFSKDYIICKS